MDKLCGMAVAARSKVTIPVLGVYGRREGSAQHFDFGLGFRAPVGPQPPGNIHKRVSLCDKEIAVKVIGGGGG